MASTRDFLKSKKWSTGDNGCLVKGKEEIGQTTEDGLYIKFPATIQKAQYG